MCPFVSLPLEERLDVGRDCVPPGMGIVCHRDGIGEPALSTQSFRRLARAVSRRLARGRERCAGNRDRATPFLCRNEQEHLVYFGLLQM